MKHKITALLLAAVLAFVAAAGSSCSIFLGGEDPDQGVTEPGGEDGTEEGGEAPRVEKQAYLDEL